MQIYLFFKYFTYISKKNIIFAKYFLVEKKR
jgi:hypothetical protein